MGDACITIIHIGDDDFNFVKFRNAYTIEVFAKVRHLAGDDDVDDLALFEIIQDASILPIDIGLEFYFIDAKHFRKASARDVFNLVIEDLHDAIRA
jgi:hypothetical protein